MNEYDYEKTVMGSEASISIIAATRSIADAAAAVLFEIARNEEMRFSRFVGESELSRLNAKRSLIVSEAFMEALLLGKELYRMSAGAFNPLVNISRFGYDATIAAVRGTNRDGTEVAPYNIDMDAIEINQDTMMVTLQEGQHLDMGGYIKGHTAEKMAKAADNCQGVVVNLGGDIYARGLDVEGRPFSYEVDNPTDPHAGLAFHATNVGIATSGSYGRHWNRNGGSFFHILDETGLKNPVTKILSATVIASTGSQSDALATAALILGGEAGGKLLTEHGCEYCFIRHDGSLVLSNAFPSVHNIKPYLYV